MNTLDIQLRLCAPDEFEAQAMLYDVKPWYGVKWLRGFCLPSKNLIVMRNGYAGELALMVHEYGHLRGKEHTISVSIMNFSGLFRWLAFILYDLRLLVTPLYARYVKCCGRHSR